MSKARALMCLRDVLQQRLVDPCCYADTSAGEIGDREFDAASQHLRGIGQAQSIILLQPLDETGARRLERFVQ